jgi:hypothetical protein
VQEGVGAGVVIVGLGSFITGYALKERGQQPCFADVSRFLARCMAEGEHGVLLLSGSGRLPSHRRRFVVATRPNWLLTFIRFPLCTVLRD